MYFIPIAKALWLPMFLDNEIKVSLLTFFNFNFLQLKSLFEQSFTTIKSNFFLFEI